MGGNAGIGKGGVILAALVALAMCVVSFFVNPIEVIPIQYGLWLDSPDSWQIEPLVSLILDIVLIGAITFLLYVINRKYNFIRTTEPVLPALFMVMACSSPWFNQNLNTSTLLCLVNVACLGIIFGAYDSRNATHQMFVLGGASGLGSMFQYAFLPMACVYLIWALIMKVLRMKEVLAFILGLACPYWIGLGFGWLRFSQFHLPSLVSLFNTPNDHSDILFLLAGIGLATIIGFLAASANSMKLYAGNSRVNAMNLCVTTLGLASVVCILVDYENIPAYVMTLYMCTTVQVANICALWHTRSNWWVTFVPASLFVCLFIGNLIV